MNEYSLAKVQNVYPIIMTTPMDSKERWEPIGCFLIFFRFPWGQMSYLVIVSVLISIAPLDLQ